MRLTRRQCLAGGCGSLAALAGCTTSEGSGSAETATDDAERTPSDGPLTLAFGETAVFTNDEAVELHLTPTAARLTEAVVVGGKGGIDQVSAFTPDGPEARYLLVTFQVANEGSSSTKLPGGLSFVTDEDRVSRTFMDVSDQNYGDLDWVDAGESVEGTVVFEVPADAPEGHVEAKFQTMFQSPPVLWRLDLDSVERTTFDFEGKRPGERIEFGTEEYRYAFAALGATETDAYTDGDGEEHTAPEGRKFVFVEVESENVGESPVTLPTAYGMRLLADGSEFENVRYEHEDEAYTGGPSDPGEVQTGEILFEVPESAAEFTLQVEFSNGPIGTWDLE